MALVLRNAALQKNVSLLKCIKTRTVVTTANKNNNQAPLSTPATSSLMHMDGWTRPLELDSIGTQSKRTLIRSSSCRKLASSGQLLVTILSKSQFLAPKLSMQKRNYTCKPPACCLPPPCNTPPRCMQFMTGYYYYPYGTWFCGPYHDAKCCPISKGACCCAACLAAQGAVANASMSTAVAAPMANYAHAATTWSNQAAQMAYAMRARAQSQASPQVGAAEVNSAKPDTIPIELPSGTAQGKTEEEKKPRGPPPDASPPVKPPHFTRFFPFP